MTHLPSLSDQIATKTNGVTDAMTDDAAPAAYASEFHGQRAMKIWMLVMLSMDREPKPVLCKALLQDERLSREFYRRVRFIRANLTILKDSVAPGVLYFKNHPGSKPSSKEHEQYVDVVTAVRALRHQFGTLPYSVNEMEHAAAALPIPSDWHDETGVFVEDGAPKTEVAVFESPQSKPTPAQKRVSNNANKLLAAFVKLHFGVLNRNSIAGHAKSLFTEFEEHNIDCGLGEFAIRTQLLDALSTEQKP
ncbi:hypothetical protein J2W23_006250 [Variovorax boronicumulans]|uniref:hypothetical protein n=1 Tax=Variovorax boronicumulans TaxID=436515 RepID=UPI0027833414|nr:hypothetical protein [Variovorax boronicumulans]MDQ0017834.1 hypothetical protein [Variovorax boronicumulans]